jgi:hypothetical protein
MPYAIIKVSTRPTLYEVINSETGVVHAKHTTLAKARSQVRLMHTFEKYGSGGGPELDRGDSDDELEERYGMHLTPSERAEYNDDSDYGCGPYSPGLQKKIAAQNARTVGGSDFYGGGGELHRSILLCPGTEGSIVLLGAGTIPKQDEIYLALSSESYKAKGARDPDVLGFRYDQDVSTERTAVYVGSDRIIIANRGTVPTDQSDLKADALIVAGQFDKSDRLKRSLKTVADVAAKYPGVRLEMTGHSLGGKVAQMIGLALPGVKVVTFNMGSSPLDIATSLKDKALCALTNSERCKRLKNQTHYSTGIDPISFASNFLHGSKHVSAEHVNVHGLSNFRPKGGRRRFTQQEKMDIWKNEGGWK